MAQLFLEKQVCRTHFPSVMRASFERFLREFGPVERPSIVRQQFLDTDVKVAKRLCGLSSKPPYEGDLFAYVSHLQYVPIEQPQLIVYLLPMCLHAWQNEIMRNVMRGFAAHFDAALTRHNMLQTLLTPAQCAAVSGFMRDVMLDRLAQQNNLLSVIHPDRAPWQWMSFLADYGTFVSDIASLWHTWWAMEGTGHAVAALQYASCLMYPAKSNPVVGIGDLWEYEQLNYDARWLPANVAFLERILNVAYLREKVAFAVHQLEGTDEEQNAQRIYGDFAEWEWLVEARCQELPRFLEQPATSYYEWSL